MAKINPVKVKQEADKLEKGGKVTEAIALYKQLIEDNPRDWNIINKVGDLYAKLNKFREAAEQYAKVADFYAKDGFHLKAIAIWKKINKLDATSLDPYLNLAELYGKQGLMMEAKSHYQIVVDEYIKRGKTREAGDVLKKMAEIDPGDLKVRSKLADLYTREGSAEGPQDRRQEQPPAPGAGEGPPRPEELRQGHAVPRGGGPGLAEQRRGHDPPGRGLPRLQENRGGGGSLQAPDRDEPGRRGGARADGARAPHAGTVRPGL
ncbi:MAG: hypothetical protein DMF78_02970 [Acidobacteria bacterium]|nr:MAG: hypothetical protein DMF78_02970 [Acidobacteriota bacterium]